MTSPVRVRRHTDGRVAVKLAYGPWETVYGWMEERWPSEEEINDSGDWRELLVAELPEPDGKSTAQGVVRGGVAVFAVRDGKFVVGQRCGSHAAGTWSVPGGWMEYGESIEDAARRELAEETGLGLENSRVVGVFSDFYPEAGKHCLGVWMIGDAVGEPVEREPDKFTNLRWCDRATLPSPLMPAWERARAAGVRDNLWRILEEMR